MNDGLGGETYSTIQDQIPPNVHSFQVSGLQAELEYSFTIESFNFNQAGAPSTAASFVICTEPSEFASPIWSEISA